MLRKEGQGKYIVRLIREGKETVNYHSKTPEDQEKTYEALLKVFPKSSGANVKKM